MPIVHGQLFVGHRAGEHEAVVQQAVLGHQRADRRIVPRHDVVPPDEDEPVVGVDVPLVVLGEPDVVLDLLVRRDPADEQEIDQAVVEDPLERRPLDALGHPRGVDGDGEDAGAGEKPSASSSWRLYSESPSARSDLADERRQFLASERGQPEERGIVRREEGAGVTL